MVPEHGNDRYLQEQLGGGVPCLTQSSQLLCLDVSFWDDNIIPPPLLASWCVCVWVPFNAMSSKWDSALWCDFNQGEQSELGAMWKGCQGLKTH